MKRKKHNSRYEERSTKKIQIKKTTTKQKKNLVSGVVELDDAYVIIKMLNPNDTTAAASY